MMLHCMAKNPDVQEQLYNEIKSVLGERTQPTPEDLRKMPYLKGCIMESFRYLYTVEPPNKGHFGTNINSAVLSLVERLSSSRRFSMYENHREDNILRLEQCPL